MTEPVWLPLSVVLAIHERQIAEHGGLSGVRDANLLESALARAQNAYAYGERDLCALAALYAHGLARNHPFADGNKRTSFVACELFLAANGVKLTAPDEECIAMAISLAAGQIDEAAVTKWLRKWAD